MASLSSSIHLSGAPPTSVPIQPLRTIATGVSQVENMYNDMRALEIAKNEEIRNLRAQVAALEAEVAERAAREQYLTELAAKLERKVARRDKTIQSLDHHVNHSRRHAEELSACLVEAEATEQRIMRAAQERRALEECFDAENRAHEDATAALAMAERSALKYRTRLLDADFSEESLVEVSSQIREAAYSHADLAFYRSLASLTEVRRTVAKVLLDVRDSAVSHTGRAIMAMLRRVSDEVAEGTRAAFFSSALAGTLTDGLRRAIRGADCGGECTLTAYRCMTVCEAEVLRRDFGSRRDGSATRGLDQSGDASIAESPLSGL